MIPDLFQARNGRLDMTDPTTGLTLLKLSTDTAVTTVRFWLVNRNVRAIERLRATGAFRGFCTSC